MEDWEGLGGLGRGDWRIGKGWEDWEGVIGGLGRVGRIGRIGKGLGRIYDPSLN